MLSDLKKIRADLWVFDNDGTLYINVQGIQSAVERLMVEFLEREYDLSHREAARLRQRLLGKHNTRYTAMAVKREGLDVGRFIQDTYLSVDPEDHGIQRCPALYRLISSLNGEKIVLTNNPSSFARRILCALGVGSLFSDVLGMEETGFVQKPDREAFAVLEEPLEIGKSVVVVDDSLDNVQTAKRMGCFTVLVGEGWSKKQAPDIYLASLIRGERDENRETCSESMC